MRVPWRDVTGESRFLLLLAAFTLVIFDDGAKSFINQLIDVFFVCAQVVTMVY